MFKTLLQNNCSISLNFKINAIKKPIKFEIKSIKFEMRLFKIESTSLTFNNNEIINVVNTNFNVFKLNVFDLKICEIKEFIVNSHLIFLLIRYNVFETFKASLFNLIISFRLINLLANLLNIQILNLIMRIVKI